MVRVPLLLPLGAAMVSSSEEVQKLASSLHGDVPTGRAHALAEAAIGAVWRGVRSMLYHSGLWYEM